MEIRLFLIDDQEILRAGVKAVFADTVIHVVGEAKTADEAFERMARTRPDVVLWDIQGTRWNGTEFLSELRHRFPKIKVVVYTTANNPVYMAQAAAYGVKDYVLKTASTEQLRRILQNVYYGTNVSENEDWTRVLNTRQTRGNLREKTRLTDREEQVLRLLVLGLSNKEIARSLRVMPDTVKEHLQNIFHKLSVADRTQAAVWAVRKGIA
ncbi:MAG: response regulator transcription factor [Planctomycetia bacterium]|nr:response regulator transcription factor [Planctomycetia bacterium]